MEESSNLGTQMPDNPVLAEAGGDAEGNKRDSETATSDDDSSKDSGRESGDEGRKSVESKKDAVVEGESAESSSMQESKEEDDDPMVQDGWVDVLGSRQLYKKTISKPADPERKPSQSERVFIRLKGCLDDGTIVEETDELSFLLQHLEVIQALDLCLKLMAVGEIAQIKTNSRFAYGSYGREPDIPPNSDITYEVELLRIEPGVDVREMNARERLEFGNHRKQRGNYYFSRMEYDQAITVYEGALNAMNVALNKETDAADDKKELRVATVPVVNNLCACQLKIQAWDAALQSANRVLRNDPKNVKAIFRKGKALLGKGDLNGAYDVFQDVVALDSNSKAAKAEMHLIKRMQDAERQKEHALYRKMMSDVKSSDARAYKADTNWKKLLTWSSVGILIAGVSSACIAYYMGQQQTPSVEDVLKS